MKPSERATTTLTTADTSAMRSALMAGTVVVACVVGACSGSAATGGVERAASHVATPTIVERETPSAPSPVAASPPAPASATGHRAYAASDQPIRAGTYATREFRIPFTADIDTDLGIRDAGDTEPFVYIGQDKNAPLNSDEEFDAMLLSRVVDPIDQRALAPMEDDVFEWFVDHPRLTPVRGSDEAFDVDGLPALQVDLVPTDPVPCGSFHTDKDCVLIGFGPPGDEPFAVFAGSRLRIVVVDHQGTAILFAYQAQDDERFPIRSGVFDRWVRSVDFIG